MSIKRALVATGNRLLRPTGLQVTRVRAPMDERQAAQHASAQVIIARHARQDEGDVRSLSEKYQAPLFGEVDTWELLLMLGRCVDPTDQRLGAASQLIHVLQVLDMMLADGITDEDLLLVALFHDLGKVLLLSDEDPANVVCLNHHVSGEPGGGLDQLVTNWNHDEFAFQRLVDVLPPQFAQLVRFHSILPDELAPYLSPADQEFAQQLHTPFARYDHESKSSFLRPMVKIDDFRDLVRRRMPARLDI